MAELAMRRGEWERAAKLYREYLTDHPHDVLALRQLAEVECYKLGQYDSCAYHADTLLTLMPADSQGVAVGAYAHTMLAKAASNRDDTTRAKEELRKVGEIYYHAGYWNYMNENYRAAEWYLRQAARLLSDSVKVYLRLGILFWNRHMEDSALVWFQRAEQVDPNNEDALINQIVVYQDQNRMDEALKVYDRLMALRARLYPDSTFEAPIDTTRLPVIDYRGEQREEEPFASF